MFLAFNLSPKDNKKLIDIVNGIVDSDSNKEKDTQEKNNDSPAFTNLKKLKTMAVKGMIGVVDSLGDNAVNIALQKFKPIVRGALSHFFIKNGIVADINDITLVKEGNTMRVTAEIDNIDYVSIIDKFLPIIFGALKKKDPDNILCAIADVLDENLTDIIKATLNSVSGEKKEQIIKLLILHYHDTICRKSSEIMSEHQINMEVTSIEVK